MSDDACQICLRMLRLSRGVLPLLRVLFGGRGLLHDLPTRPASSAMSAICLTLGAPQLSPVRNLSARIRIDPGR